MLNPTVVDNTLLVLVLVMLTAMTGVAALIIGYLLAGTSTKSRHRPPSHPMKPNIRPAKSTQTSLGGLLAAATIQGGKAQNQDSFFYEDFGAAKVIVLADGISSSDYGTVAARQLTQTFYAALQQATTLSLNQAFLVDTCRLAARRLSKDLTQQATAETTLILLAELADRFVLAYLGDGAVVWARGNLSDGKSLLLAHHDEYGRLSGYVNANGPSLAAPAVMEISKTTLEDGQIFVVGTDGALPPRKETGHAFSILNNLLDQAKAAGRTPAPAEIAEYMSDYLTRAKPHDNATLGLLFTEAALAYWQRQCSTDNGDKPNAKPARALVAQAQPHL